MIQLDSSRYIFLQMKKVHEQYLPLIVGLKPTSIGFFYFRFNGCWVVFFIFIQILIEHSASNFANSGDPGQVSGSAACDLGLHCCPTKRTDDHYLLLDQASQNVGLNLDPSCLRF